MRLLKVKEVGERLNISVAKCYELVESGKLGHHRLDGAIRISEEQVKEYLAMTERAPDQKRRPHSIPRPVLRRIRI